MSLDPSKQPGLSQQQRQRSFADIAAAANGQVRSPPSNAVVNPSNAESEGGVGSMKRRSVSGNSTTTLSLGVNPSLPATSHPEDQNSNGETISPKVIARPSATPPKLSLPDSAGADNASDKSDQPSGSAALAEAKDEPVLDRAKVLARRKSDGPDDNWPDVGRLSIDDRQPSTSAKPLEKLAVGHGSSLLQKALARSTINDRDGDDATSNASFTESPLFPPSFNEKFLFDDEAESGSPTSSYVKNYLQLNTDDDKFPILVRRDSFPGMLSASSAALDLAPLSQTPPRQSRVLEDLLARNSEWPQFSSTTSAPTVPTFASTSASTNQEAIGTLPAPVRPSITPEDERSQSDTNIQDDAAITSMPQNSASYAEGRPDATSSNTTTSYQYNRTPSFSSLQQAARSSNPSGNSVAPYAPFAPSLGNGPSPTSQPFHPSGNAMYGAFTSGTNGANVVNGTSANRAQNPAAGLSNAPPMSNPANAVASAAKSVHKRSNNDPDANRFAGVNLEDLLGDIYSLCKDQHGCRYLQKKLEEGNEKYLNMIFNEVFSHFVELMTDPFGNYLCQKLLEYCNDDQRTVIVETVANELVNISLNMHGTRAVQKLIEYLSTPQQIHMVVIALNTNVVTLIKDLNGNHVIQKCLNRLSSDDDQFIYNAVSQNCIEVATHRHGCCVLQRCIDHASESQKMQLVAEITFHALTLVQDPFGNYVVQYVLDLNDPRFTDSLIRRFIGNVCLLSVQKFSSNVMEKCIRVSEPETRKYLIEEMLNKTRLEKLLRDSYANYVVQTSLDCADPAQRHALVECIRPLLPAIRNTPYGKRIQGKLHREQMQAMSVQNGMPPQLMTPQGAMPVNLNGYPPAINGHHLGHPHAQHQQPFMAQHRGSMGNQVQPQMMGHPSHQFPNGPPPMSMGMMNYSMPPHHQAMQTNHQFHPKMAPPANAYNGMTASYGHAAQPYNPQQQVVTTSASGSGISSGAYNGNGFM